MSFRATPIKAPECVSETTGYFYAEDELFPDPASALPPLSHFYLVVRNMGLNAVAAAPAYDFGHYATPGPGVVPLTGLTVPEPRPQWQRAARTSSTADSSSAFQLHCYDAGSFINTWTFPYMSVAGSGAHSVYGYDFPQPAPAFDDAPSTDVVLQASLEVPWLALWPSPTTGEQPIGQWSLFAYFRERTTGKLFAILLLLFDNRLGGRNLRAVRRARFPHALRGYAARLAGRLRDAFSGIGIGHRVSWTGLRFFRVHITQDNFRTVLRDINAYCAAHSDWPFCAPAAPGANAFSDDVMRYDVALFGVLHEVGHGPDSNISMGIHVFDVGVWNFR